MNITKEPLRKTNPELIKEWDYELNKDIDIESITIGSHKDINWICKNNHRWIAKVYHRKNNGCPYCNGKKTIKGENDIFSVYPNLKKEWDYSKNEIDPSEIFPNSTKSAWWICSNNHSYPSKIVNRTKKGHGCPICSNQLIVTGINDLQTIYPEIAKEWDYELNTTTPDKVAPSAKMKYYWRCKNNHSWEASVNKRTSAGNNCPVCINRKIVTGTNDLQTLYPEIAKEWSEKNDLKPYEVSIGSKYKAIWKCSKCNEEWESSVFVRKNYGCPRCKESKGEKRITEFLSQNKITYQPQYRFTNCKYKKPLPFDFAILENNKVILLIEYDGIQHFKCVGFGNKTQEEQEKELEIIKLKDNIKTNYCKNNNIPLLRIKYTEYEKIEGLLSNALIS